MDSEQLTRELLEIASRTALPERPAVEFFKMAISGFEIQDELMNQAKQQHFSLGGFKSPLVAYVQEHQLIERISELQQLVPKVSEQLYKQEVVKNSVRP